MRKKLVVVGGVKIGSNKATWRRNVVLGGAKIDKHLGRKVVA